MAHPYTTSTLIGNTIGSTLRAELADPNGSGSEDTNVTTEAISKADNEIDALLGQKYSVPFAAVSDSPATPGMITDASTLLAAANLYAIRHGTGEDSKYEALRAQALNILEGIRSGELYLSATLVDADNASVGLDYTGTDPVFGGRDDNDTNRMSGW